MIRILCEIPISFVFLLNDLAQLLNSCCGSGCESGDKHSGLTVLNSSTKVVVECISTKISGNGLFSSHNLFGHWLVSSSSLPVTLKKFAERLHLTSPFGMI